MRIAYIYPALATVGGADRVITEKANYFADIYGYEVFIITAHQNKMPIYFPLSPKVNHIDLDVNFNKQYNHSIIIRGWIYFKLLRIYKKKLTKVLFSIHPNFTITTISRDIDFLTNIKDGSFKIAEAHISKKYIRNLHIMKQRNLLHRLVANIWTKKLENAIKRFSALVVLTQDDAKNWEHITKATVIPNSLPFYPTKTSNCESKKIITIGRLDEQEGYDLLINAWKKIANKYPDWKIYVYGDGALYDELCRMIEKNNLKNSFIIEKPVKDICNKYLNSSIYVMSSRFEGFGMALIEAMACGLPTISFDCPNGPADIIKDNIDGMLVKDGDIDELSKKISYLIENDDIRKKMGKKARENIKRYSKKNIMEKWVELFKSKSN